MKLVIALVATCIATTARAEHLEWSIGGGADNTCSTRGSPSTDVVVTTGATVTGQAGFFTYGGTGSLEISEGFGMRIGAVAGAEKAITDRSRLMLLAEGGAHRVIAQPDADSTLPYVGLRIGIDRARTPQGGRTHGFWLAWQQDLDREVVTHMYEVCPILSPCHDEEKQYELGGWSVMFMYRLGYVAR